MKTKIKEALQQEYKNLGLNDEAFDGVAAFGETIGITEETLANFVKGAKGLLTKAQSDADKVRSVKTESQKQIDDLKAKLADAEAKLNDKGNDPELSQTPNIAELVQSAVAAAVQPLQDKLKAFEDEGASKQALKAAKDALFGNDYAKKYTQERDAAWERAVEIYEATGKKMTAEELKEKVMGYFNKDVARKGVDTTKPFEGEDGADKEPDFSAQKKYLQEQGLIPKEEKYSLTPKPVKDETELR